MFVTYDDKSYYPCTCNVLRKKVICEENIYQLNLVKRFKKWSDLSLYDHKSDLIIVSGIQQNLMQFVM